LERVGRGGGIGGRERNRREGERNREVKAMQQKQILG
jgi:hypothetical protein